MSWNTCFKCKCKMWIDDPLNEAALNDRGVIAFYCSYGHKQFYIHGETEEQKLRRERDLLKQQTARLNDEIAAERRRAEAAEKKAAKIKRRAEAGVCPCCNRTFINVQRHMKSKHPNVVPLGQKQAVS